MQLQFCHTGHGNFGSVLKGEYTKGNGETIPVAVKKLKSEEMNNPKVQIIPKLIFCRLSFRLMGTIVC